MRQRQPTTMDVGQSSTYTHDDDTVGCLSMGIFGKMISGLNGGRNLCGSSKRSW